MWSSCPGDSSGDPTIRYDYYDDSSPIFTSPLLVRVFYKRQRQEHRTTVLRRLGRLGTGNPDRPAEVEGSGDKDIVVTTAYDARGLAVCTTVPYTVTAYVYSKITRLTLPDDACHKIRSDNHLYDDAWPGLHGDDARWATADGLLTSQLILP